MTFSTRTSDTLDTSDTRHYYIQHNNKTFNIQPNNSQHNNNQHSNKKCDNQHNDTLHSHEERNTQHKRHLASSVIMLIVILFI